MGDPELRQEGDGLGHVREGVAGVQLQPIRRRDRAHLRRRAAGRGAGDEGDVHQRDGWRAEVSWPSTPTGVACTAATRMIRSSTTRAGYDAELIEGSSRVAQETSIAPRYRHQRRGPAQRLADRDVRPCRCSRAMGTMLSDAPPVGGANPRRHVMRASRAVAAVLCVGLLAGCASSEPPAQARRRRARPLPRPRSLRARHRRPRSPPPRLRRASWLAGR